MRTLHRAVPFGLLVTAVLLAAACSPTADPTATVPAPTATTAAAPTATSVARATATTGQTPAATTATAIVVPTATVGEVRLRPVPVLTRPAPNPSAQRGGTYRQLWDTLRVQDWSTLEITNSTYTGPAWDTLLESNSYEPDKGDQVLPSLASDWWTNASGTTWTLKLRDNVRFSDNTLVTCADAKFTLDVARTGQDAKGSTLRTSVRGALLKRVTGVTCPDDKTIAITTDGPMPALPYALSSTSFAIMPKHVFEGNLKLLQTQIGPGTGPFLFDKYVIGEKLSLKRKPDYWNQPYPYLDAIEQLILGSPTAAQSAFRVGRGERYSFVEPPTTLVNQMVSEGKLIVGKGGWSHGIAAIFGNRQKAPWSDSRFSLALRCAINTENYIKTSTTPNNLESPVFAMPDQAGGTSWSISKDQWKAIGPCYGPTAETNMAQRQQMAKDLLGQLGFTPQNPAKPAFVVASGVDVSSIINDLTAVGIQPEVQVRPTANVRLNYVAGEYDLGQNGYASNFLDPDFFLYELYHSSSDRNYSRYVSAELDALIDQQSRTLDAARRKQLLVEVQQFILRNNPQIVIQHTVNAPTNVLWVNDDYMVQPFPQTSWQQRKQVWIDQAKLKQILG